MEYFSEIYKGVAPFIGVFIGWLLTRKNENDKIKYSEIRQIKRSLYVLLEIRNQITINMRLDKYSNLYVKKINAATSNISDNLIEKDQFKEYNSNLIATIIGEDYQRNLKEQFVKCIDNLSEIDPIMTYKISGKQNIKDYIESWEIESKKYCNFETDEDFNDIMGHFKPSFVDDIRKNIESLLIDLAHLISNKEVKSIRELLEKPDNIEKDIDADVEKVLSVMREKINLNQMVNN